jgi:chaperonin GroEL
MQRMTSLVRPTLGPLPRTVAIDPIVGSRPPEVLDSAAVIARRTLQLRDPFEDMGGMLIRHLVWRVYDQVGDGAATAAVLAESLTRAGVRYIAAGGNPIPIRRGMQGGLEVAVAALQRQARAIDGPDEIARALVGDLRDAELARAIGEVVDAVGPDGALSVEDAQSTLTSHEYIDGVRWNEGYVSPFLLDQDAGSAIRLLDPRILVTDYALERAEQVLPTLEACVAAGERRLFIVAPEIRDGVVGMLVANRERGMLDGAIAVRAPLFGGLREGVLEDIAAITGGHYVCQARGDRLDDVTLATLGRARHAWATRAAFGILGGEGDKAVIRQRIAFAKAELQAASDADAFTRDKLKERIGKLAGTAAIIRVGAATTTEQEELKLRVEAAVKSARSGLQEGMLPGSGAALLACALTLGSLEVGGDEAFGVQALAAALAEPMRVILENAGFEAAPIVERARQCPGSVFDVVRREWVEAHAAGIVEPLAVTRLALESAVSTAMTALTAEVLIHRPDAPRAVEP